MRTAPRKLTLSTKLSFGKYKNKDMNIYQLIGEDLDYINWLLTVWVGPIDDKVTKMFNEFWERRNYELHGFRNDINSITGKRIKW
jgi:hypothetical protein